MTTTTHSTHDHSAASTNVSKLTAALESYRARRSARALRSRIERELSSYRTPAEVHELDAMLERSGDDIDPVYADVIERLRLRAA